MNMRIQNNISNLNKPPEKKYEAYKKRNIKKIIKRLWDYATHQRLLIALALILSIGGNLLALVGPMLSGLAIDAIAPGKNAVDFNSVFYYCFLMAIFYIISSALGYALSVLMIKLSQQVAFNMREDVFNHMMTLPAGYFDTHQTGDIISRFGYDIDTINTTLSNDLIQIVATIVTVIGSLIMMLILSPVLTLVFAVMVPLSVIFSRYIAKRAQVLFRARSEKIGELNGYVEETVGGQKTIKTFNRESVMTDRFDIFNNTAIESYYKADYYGSIMGPSVGFINNLSLTIVSVFGALLYLFGNLSLGSISSFILYSRKFSGPINELANIYGELQSTLAAADRVFALLDEAPESADINNACEFNNIRGELNIKNISFSYIPGTPVLKNLSLNANSGALIAIVGHTGAGKTTLINLLMRFYDPDSGVINLDNKNIREATRVSLRRSWAMVLQDTWLFGGTIAENIAYGRPESTRAEIEQVARAAHIHDAITKLPNGYDTPLDGSSVNLSQGQRQLITIARAMLLDAHMLILDEATSNVDTRTERLIQQAMRNLMADKTCFVIAHRLSTIVDADMILVMESGNVVEQGTHRELLAAGGHYAKLYGAQFE